MKQFNNNDQTPFRKLSPVRIFEQAAEQIKELINEGYFQDGEKLPPEQELSKQLNVSRSSIREALRVLESEGLVEIKRGLGAYLTLARGQRRSLRDVSQWLKQRKESLEQVLQVRECIEGTSAALAAKHASAEALRKIRDLIEEQISHVEIISQTGDENYDILSQLDVGFHLAISEASGNDIIHEIVSHVVPSFSESNKAVLYVSKRMDRTIEEHLEILKALEAGDAETAERVMRAHISQVRREIVKLNNGI